MIVPISLWYLITLIPKLGKEIPVNIIYYLMLLLLLLTLSLRLQSCPTLCNPVDYSLQGSFAHGILQARICGGLPCPSPGDLPDLRIELGSPALQADSLPPSHQGRPYWLISLYKYRCKHPQEKTRNQIEQHIKNHTLLPSEIFPWKLKLASHPKINHCNKTC